MLIKVNRIRTESQLKIFQSANILNVCLQKNDMDIDSNAINIETLSSFVEIVDAKKISLYFTAYSNFSMQEINDVLMQYDIGFVEFVCPDFYKNDEFKGFKESLKSIDKPIILSGFSISKDDLSLLEDYQYFYELLNVGVKYFQIEIDSMYDREFTLPANKIKEIDAFVKGIPVLVTDWFSEKKKVALENIEGIYVTLNSAKKDIYMGSPQAASHFKDILSLKTFSPRSAKSILSSIHGL